MTLSGVLQEVPESAWFKSSYSGDTGNNCVEVAALAGRVGVRDSKVRSGPALVVPSAAWSSFVAFASA
ncbi:hypothetical protein GCM10010387_44480 [Streptomyces inusitatus]|uniref:DUF397 domain-containing protein n=1 Tax=Streptomyces inusitatus TaxID=68221 RepID=A0A918QGR7_9ACTN|nr:DUF397 domain-containing protein [Streptomyces inusitatus]GGZ45081.1 hypothetical protein GCM10010387_44440 [Streptomyces inusitatus]GGZ45106.1 hypothetical protein GCM10010387_44480 [Streptomyces inusitatus]